MQAGPSWGKRRVNVKLIRALNCYVGLPVNMYYYESFQTYTYIKRIVKWTPLQPLPRIGSFQDFAILVSQHITEGSYKKCGYFLT